MLFARRFVFVWAECAGSLTPVAFLWYKVGIPLMDGAPAVIAGIMVVAQWGRPFGSLPSGAGLWLSGFLESVEVFVFIVQGKGKGKDRGSWVFFSGVSLRSIISLRRGVRSGRQPRLMTFAFR